MTDKKLTNVTDNNVGRITDSEIVKALEEHIDFSEKMGICYSPIIYIPTLKNVLDLINRLQAENEDLKIDIATLEAKNFVKDKVIAKTEAKLDDIDNLLKELVGEDNG